MSEAAREAMQAYYDTCYPDMIEKVHRLLTGHAGENCIYTIGPSSGIVRFGEHLFAIDPAIRGQKGLEASADALRQLFSQVPLVFITHAHSDHFDMALNPLLADLPIRWVIPGYIGEERIVASGLRRENILRVAPGDRLVFGDLCVDVFDGKHYDADGIHGCEAVGYYMRCGGRSLLFLCDVRQYDAKFFPAFPSVDSLFMGVWLGRGQALQPDAGLLEQFCGLVASYKPQKAFLWHLYQSGRKLPDMWDYTHGGMIMDKLTETNPEIESILVKTGCRYALFD